MYTYVKHLYDHEDAKDMPAIEESSYTQECFDSNVMLKGMKKLVNGKASDTLHLCSEMLKWSGNLAKMWIHALLNQALSQGLPIEWQHNWVKALFKNGDKNQPTNYQTIMVGSCMSKLLGSILEQEISTWAENNNKRARGQAGFRPKHSTIDHLISLRVLMEESRLKGNPYFVALWTSRKLLTWYLEMAYGKEWNTLEFLNILGMRLHAYMRKYDANSRHTWGSLKNSRVIWA